MHALLLVAATVTVLSAAFDPGGGKKCFTRGFKGFPDAKDTVSFLVTRDLKIKTTSSNKNPPFTF